MNLSDDLNGCSVFSILELMPNSFSEVENFANMVIDNVNDGYTDSLKIWAQMKHLEILVEKIKEGIERAAIDDLSKYSDKDLPQKQGFQFALVPTYTGYDFTACKDSVFNDINEKLTYHKEELKKRTGWLVTLKTPALIEDTGELIYPPVKTQKIGLKLTKAKENKKRK